MFQLTGRLIDGKSAYSWLVEYSSKTSEPASICSAFLRSSIIHDLSAKFKPNSSARVMVRWQLGDLLAGASDLEAYELCRKLGWKFFVCMNFHGKIFHLPPHGILVGSANATESGFGLQSQSNSEACTIIEESNSNVKFVNNLFDLAYELNDELFKQMLDIYKQAEKGGQVIDWPSNILKQIQDPSKKAGKLFLSECFRTDGEEILSRSTDLSFEAKSDLSLLGVPTYNFSEEIIATHFCETKIYLLLIDLLKERGGEIYFGTLTSAIHNWLIEDPVPHRRAVKVLVKNLYCWIEKLDTGITKMSVDRPDYSERIRLI